MTSMALMEDEAQSLRDELRSAHTRRANAARRLADAQAAYARGEQKVTEWQAALQAHDKEADRIAAAEAARLAAEAAGRPTTPAPEDRSDDRAQARILIDRRLVDAGRALNLLAAEVEAARTGVASATHAIKRAAGALAASTAEQMRGELVATEVVARDLRASLAALAHATDSGLGSYVGPKVVRTLRDWPLNHPDLPFHTPRDPVTEETKRWRGVLAALLVDPEVPIQGMEE